MENVSEQFLSHKKLSDLAYEQRLQNSSGVCAYDSMIVLSVSQHDNDLWPHFTNMD